MKFMCYSGWFHLWFFGIGTIVLRESLVVWVDALALGSTGRSSSSSNMGSPSMTQTTVTIPATTLILPTIESSMNDDYDDDVVGDDNNNNNNNNNDTEDWDALSCFGTKQYWDKVYAGMGDFPSEQYSWYYGYNEIQPYLQQYFRSTTIGTDRLLLPGIGNDTSFLWNILRAGYRHVTVQDYSRGALSRQLEMLDSSTFFARRSLQSTTIATTPPPCIRLSHSDVKHLPFDDESFDGIIEKGLLDAVYLSGKDNLPLAVQSLSRCLKSGGILLSVSGVVPPTMWNKIFSKDDYEWLRDGSHDLKAGCFIWKKKKKSEMNPM